MKHLLLLLLSLQIGGLQAKQAPNTEVNPTRQNDAQKAQPASDDTLTFLNHDVLHGKLVSIDALNGLTWRHSQSAESIQFHTRGLRELSLGGRSTPAQAGNVSVIMTNGDEIVGALKSITAQSIELDTAYAGRLLLPRKVTRSITLLGTTSASIYEGPDGLTGWKSMKPGDNSIPPWRYDNHAFYTSKACAIGHFFKMPEMVSIEFDLNWIGPLSFAINLYCSSLEAVEPNPGYVLQIDGNMAALSRVRNDNPEELGATEIPEFELKNSAHVSILVNKQKKLFVLLVNGVVIKQWIDPGAFAGSGNGVVFISQGEAKTKLSKIRVSAWNGQVISDRNELVRTPDDVVALNNGDRVTGKLGNYEAGHFSFLSPHGELRISLQKIERVALASPGLQGLIAPKARTVRAHFANHGKLTMEIESWDDKRIIGSSASLGRITFLPDTFRRLEFNLTHKRTKTEVDDDGDLETK